MGGGLMQLCSAQDIYLTGNPQITFFKGSRRHTNSMESIEQTFMEVPLQLVLKHALYQEMVI